MRLAGCQEGIVCGKKRRTRSSRQPNDPSENVYQTEYEITSEPLEDARYKRLPQHVKDAIERLYAGIQSHPREAIPELLQWIEQYPTIPMLYNYLSLAYSHSGDVEKAEHTILENYQRNPDYLFARINYAELCLAKHDYQKVADIFDHKFDLRLLYPKRKRFHVTEFAGFMGVIGRYFLETGNRALAEKIYDVLVQVAPEQPLTRRLRRKLYPNFFQRVADRMLNQPKSDEQ